MIKKYMNLLDYVKEYNFKNIKIVNDIQAWINNPNYNYIYNKLWISQSQDIPSGPMGVYPNRYPIIFKPIINLYGMSRGFKLINNKEEYNNNIKDGFFWQEFLDGNHYCLDLIIIKGKVVFYSSLKSIAGKTGSFLYHESIPDYNLPEHIEFWISSYLKNYTGPLNLEIINGLIIEAHLRLNGDFQLYDKNFVKSLDVLYEKGIWKLENFILEKKYLVPIFVEKNITEEKILLLKKNILKFCHENEVNSLHIDNINSISQSEHLSRAFMIDLPNLEIKNNLKIYINI